MKHRKAIFLGAALAVVLVVLGVTMAARRGRSPEQLLSAPAAQLLGGGRYYLKYTDRWLLGDGSPVEMEEARDGGTFFQRYEVEGEPLTTVSRGCTAKVWSGGELLQELSLDADPSTLYTDLRFEGETGAARLGEQELFFEEYSYRYNGERFRMRFLFAEGQLWGLEFGGDGRCLEVTALSGDIPADVAELMAA